MYASKTTRSFYDAAIHGDNMPDDVVEITAEEHAALLEGQSNGKLIDFDKDGYPFLADPEPPTAEQVILSQIAAIEATITQRRLREATLGTDNGWLSEQDAAIAALREKL